MANYRTWTGLVLGLLLGAFASYAAPDGRGAEVVAEIGGQKLTRAALEQKQTAKLLQARYQYYLAEREALDQLIDEQLVEMQARRENLTVEQLITREVISRASEPTEDQLLVFYEGMRTEEPYETARQKIVATLNQIRIGKLRAAFLQSLRSRAAIRVALAPPTAVIAVDDAPRRGPQDAPVLIVEFADYECPFCQRVAPDLKKLQQEFPGKVAVAFKDFPLVMHRNAQKAAEAARCAGQQGRFWDFHDVLFANANRLELTQLKAYARELKLDPARFDQCLDGGEQAAAVQKDLAQAQRLGLTGTPGFFINGHFVSGAVPYATLREIVAQQLTPPEYAGNTSVAQ